MRVVVITKKPSKARSIKIAGDASTGASLSEQAYEAIKSKILSLDLRPGLFLSESVLCEMTGFGRMPVHQAVHRLQSEGLIEVIPRKGLVVRMDSLHDVLALLEARLAMEPNIAGLAAERLTKEQAAELCQLLEDSKSLIGQGQGQRKAFGVIDRAFHRVVAEAAGNKILADAQRPLQERSDLIWHLRIMPEDGLEVTQREHEAVLEAILKRDAGAARGAMQAHLQSLQARILKASRL